MFQRDYIIRLITAFTQALQSILGLVRRDQTDEALMAIERALQELLGSGVAGRLLGDTPPLDGSAMLPPVKRLMASRLYREAGLIHQRQGRAEMAAQCHFQSLELLLDGLVAEPNGSEANGSATDFAPPVDDLLADLDGYILPDRLSGLLVRHYEKAGAFGKAEDALFRRLDYTDDPAALSDGIALYERLLRLSPAQLAQGGLPRSEVLAGLAELRRHPARRQSEP